MNKYINMDFSEARKFFKSLEKASKGDFKKALAEFLAGIGFEFLGIVQDEIIRQKAMDTRRLLASFNVHGEDNVWKITDGGLTLIVGSTANYAAYVNYGHKQKPGRFIPGRWVGDRFEYNKNAKGGMILKASYVKGKPYWDNALNILNRIMPGYLDKRLQEWLDNYF